MGILLNPRNNDFQQALNSEIYVDKSELIAVTNKYVDTEQRFICVSRPRRFGKSMAANMLTAYYSRGCDSREMFSSLKISKSSTFEKHLNKYNVIHINMVRYIGEAKNIEEMIEFISEDIIDEISEEFSNVKMPRRKSLINIFEYVFAETNIPFIFVIDEWDCIFRMQKNSKQSQTEYLNFLRNLLKDKSYVALAYMTGILPIKKYGEHSALNMFTEVCMTDTGEYAEFTGFTENEVKELCEKYDMTFEKTKQWYDGYSLEGVSIYNPRSVVMSMLGRKYNNYWTSTETYDALKVYIKMDFDGLKDKVSSMVAGEKVKVNIAKFQNDMTSLESADDILTLIIHLGYLTFEPDEDISTLGYVWIPNSEVQQEFINSIEDGGWEEVMKSITMSDELLEETLNLNEERVAEIIEQAHQDNTSILKYNDENSLACVISLAYYCARRKYVMHRELPTGKGFADLVFVPRKNNPNPAIVIELKQNKTANAAIEQIKNKQYTDSIKDYSGEIMLVGINYDSDKKHTCKIEKIVK